MAAYSAVEEAIRQELIKLSVFGLNEDTCGTDIDSILQSMIKQSATHGCLLSFGGAGRRTREAFAGDAPQGYSMGKGRQWAWRVFITLLIRYNADSQAFEDDLRVAIDTVKDFMADPNVRRLGGLVPNSDLVGMEPAETVELNDIPFYMFGFVIEVWDKS